MSTTARDGSRGTETATEGPSRRRLHPHMKGTIVVAAEQGK
jgi:hypothetical protein